MIKNKRNLVFAIILYVISMAINFPFPHEYPIGQEFSSVLNIPIRSINGLNYVGIIGLLLLVVSLYFLVKSLEKFHLRIVLIAIILVVFLPIGLLSAYQKTFATGINAVEYERNDSHCLFEMKNETTLSATCELPFNNHSNDIVRFNIEFYEKYLFEDETPLLSLLNEGGPYEVILHEKDRERVTINTEIDLSKLGLGSISGEEWGINVKIVEGDKVRKL